MTEEEKIQYSQRHVELLANLPKEKEQNIRFVEEQFRKDKIRNLIYPFKCKHLWIKKATGLGITELILRIMLWLAMSKPEEYKDSRLTTARNFMEYYDIEISPRKFKVKVKIPRIIKRHKEALQKEDIIKILEACSDSTKLKTYVLFLAATGCRATEACSIRLTDLDWNNHRVFIRGDFTKTGVDRFVFLTDELTQQIRQWLDFKYRERRKRLTEGPKKNIYITPKRKDTDLIFASAYNNRTTTFLNSGRKKDERQVIKGIYVTLSAEFDRILDSLGIGWEDSTKRRRKFTLHSFRRWTKSVISDVGYSDYSEWFIGHAGSTYYRKSDREKSQLFKRLEPSLTYLNQTALEKKYADLLNRMEIMEHENVKLKHEVTKYSELERQIQELTKRIGG